MKMNMKMDNQRAVLISIRPEWVVSITDGFKEMEVRKNRPNLELPFNAYIYCTMGQYENTVPATQRDILEQWRGHIIGEFACNEIFRYNPGVDFISCTANLFLRTAALLRVEDIWAYSGEGKKPLYGWMISDLKIYEKPLDLSAFRDMRGEPVKRAPQSWCYVTRRLA